MADIKQAAVWMQEGKRVRCQYWPDKKFYLHQDEDGFVAGAGGYGNMPSNPYEEMEVSDILSDDWEKVEDQSK
jgi:hypothetical protein